MKQIEYLLELCDTSGEHRAIAVFRSSSPFVSVAVGDRFDDEGWPRLFDLDRAGSPEAPRRYIVHSVKHVVVERPDKIVARYCLNLTAFDGTRSPV
jgi:hypothetical protein